MGVVDGREMRVFEDSLVVMMVVMAERRGSLILLEMLLGDDFCIMMMNRGWIRMM